MSLTAVPAVLSRILRRIRLIEEMPATFPITEAVGIVEHVLGVHVVVDWPMRVADHRFPGLNKPPHERIRLKLRLLFIQRVGEGVSGGTGGVVRCVVPDSVFFLHRCPPFPGIPAASQCRREPSCQRQVVGHSNGIGAGFHAVGSRMGTGRTSGLKLPLIAAHCIPPAAFCQLQCETLKQSFNLNQGLTEILYITSL